jgi:hypothetical protein
MIGRVLVTGSRAWVDTETIRVTLRAVWEQGPAVLGSRGATHTAGLVEAAGIPTPLLHAITPTGLTESEEKWGDSQ